MCRTFPRPVSRERGDRAPLALVRGTLLLPAPPRLGYAPILLPCSELHPLPWKLVVRKSTAPPPAE